MALILMTDWPLQKVEMLQSRVKKPQPRTDLKETSFENQRLARLGVEVISFSHLLRHTTRQALCRPERVHFCMLMLVTGGRGRHTIDGVALALTAGSLVLVRPGQVQHWHLETQYAAEILLIDPVTLRPATTPLAGIFRPDGFPAVLRLSRSGFAAARTELLALRHAIRRFDGTELMTELTRKMLEVLLLRVRYWSRAAAGGRANPAPDLGPYQLFLREVEAGFRKAHRAYHYAQRIGYSVSTLNRVCMLAQGLSAKAVIDRRIALEAQRLLVHSRASYAEIGHYLGFSEATNFVKFFVRVVGRTPSAVRREPLRRPASMPRAVAQMEARIVGAEVLAEPRR